MPNILKDNKGKVSNRSGLGHPMLLAVPLIDQTVTIIFSFSKDVWNDNRKGV